MPPAAESWTSAGRTTKKYLSVITLAPEYETNAASSTAKYCDENTTRFWNFPSSFY